MSGTPLTRACPMSSTSTPATCGARSTGRSGSRSWRRSAESAAGCGTRRPRRAEWSCRCGCDSPRPSRWVVARLVMVAGSHAGQFPAAQEVSQVLTARGLVVYSSGTESAAPLLSRGQLRQAAAGPLTSTAVVEGERLRIMATDLRFRSHWVIAVVAVPTDIADTALARARLALLIRGPAGRAHDRTGRMAADRRGPGSGDAHATPPRGDHRA